MSSMAVKDSQHQNGHIVQYAALAAAKHKLQQVSGHLVGMLFPHTLQILDLSLIHI